jgi:hypothetical protein
MFSHSQQVLTHLYHLKPRGYRGYTVYLGHPVPGGYKYGDLALQVEGSLKNWDNKI